MYFNRKNKKLLRIAAFYSSFLLQTRLIYVRGKFS